MNIFDSYSQAIVGGADTTLQFILANKRNIVREVGFFGFKQYTLNYRINFDHRNKRKILHDLNKYVLMKPTQHKSDLAISHNALTKLKLSDDMDRRIVAYMFDRLQHTFLSDYKKLQGMDAHVLKRHLVIKAVSDNILRKKCSV